MKIKNVSRHLNNRGFSDNKGFSLIELIVVIAIMAVIVGVAFASSSIMDTSYVKEVERGVEDYVGLAKSKSMSVSAKEWYMMLTIEDDEYVAKLCKTEEVTVGEGTEIKTTVIDMDSFNGKATVAFEDGAGSKEISADMPLCIYFDSATGKVSKVTVGGVAANISNGIGRIEIESGSYSIVMKLFYNTGKCERE